MSNISNNLVNAMLDAPGMAAARAGITDFGTSTAAVVRTLTDQERASYFSLDVSNKVFTEEALQEATNNGSILPSAVNVGFLSNDLGLFDQMDELESLLENELRRVRDTKRLAGHEAYAMALTIYTLFKSLAAVGVPGAQQSADRLGERFAQNGGGAPTTDDQNPGPAPTTPPAPTV